MPAPKIKLCGLNDTASLDAALEARADYVGFNFYPPSPRYLPLDLAARLGAQAQGRSGRVGVFVDADVAAIGAAVAAAKLDAIQLHGSETPEHAAALGRQFALPVWKVISVASHGDIARAKTYAGAADLILFDAKTPKGTLPGGMGLAFDWALLRGYRGTMPWGLAGGLSAANVARAIHAAAPPLVDTASGIESAPGIKDAGKIAQFCAAVREV